MTEFDVLVVQFILGGRSHGRRWTYRSCRCRHCGWLYCQEGDEPWAWSVGNLVVGLIGARLGGFVANLLGVSFGGWVGSLVVSTLGAIPLLLLLGLIKRGRHPRQRSLIARRGLFWYRPRLRSFGR